MVISTEEMSKLTKQRVIEELGVDDYEVDFYANVHPDEIIDLHETSWAIMGKELCSSKQFTPPVIRWMKDGKEYSAVVPAQTYVEEFNYLFVGGKYDCVDWIKMEKIAFNIIRDHIQSIS